MWKSVNYVFGKRIAEMVMAERHNSAKNTGHF